MELDQTGVIAAGWYCNNCSSNISQSVVSSVHYSQGIISILSLEKNGLCTALRSTAVVLGFVCLNCYCLRKVVSFYFCACLVAVPVCI